MTEKWLSDEELTAKIAALEENYKIVTEKVAQAAINLEENRKRLPCWQQPKQFLCLLLTEQLNWELPV